MHPNDDEFLYLVEGAIDVILRDDPDCDRGATHRTPGRRRVRCAEPWHRQIVLRPGKMLFLTPETLHRPYAPDDGWLLTFNRGDSVTLGIDHRLFDRHRKSDRDPSSPSAVMRLSRTTARRPEVLDDLDVALRLALDVTDDAKHQGGHRRGR